MADLPGLDFEQLFLSNYFVSRQSIKIRILLKLKFNHLSKPTIQFLVILKVAKYIADLQRSLFTITHSVTVDNHHGLEHCNRMIGSQPIIFKIVPSYFYSISFAGSTGEGSSLGKCQTDVFTEEEIRSVSWNLWPITFTSHIFFIS